MLQQDEENVEVSAVDVQINPLAEDEKYPLKNTPGKPMFFQENFPTLETRNKKDVSCLKSNSKILKTKRHKDKFKLSKLNKHLLDQTIQLPQLVKSAKYFKNKDKSAARAKVRLTSGKEKTDVLRTNELWSRHQPIIVGNLIDLGTPKTFKTKVEQSDIQLPLLPMDKLSELEEVIISNPLMTNFSSLLITPDEPSIIDVPVSTQTQKIGEVGSSVSDLSENQAASPAESSDFSENQSVSQAAVHNDFTGRTSGYELDCKVSNRSDPIQVFTSANRPDERVNSPLVTYDLGTNSPTSGKEQLLTITSCQLLVDRLKKDPFPKRVRENAKVQVRRRAFSMDDTLMAVLPCTPGEETGDTHCLINKAETIFNENSSCHPNSGQRSSSQNSMEPTEDIEHNSLPEDERDSPNSPDSHSNDENIRTNTNKTFKLSQYSMEATLGSNTDLVIDKHNGSLGSLIISSDTENKSTPERGSNSIFQPELSNVETINGDSVCNIYGNSAVPQPTAEGSEGSPGLIECSLEPPVCTPQIEDQSSSSTRDTTHIEKLCEGPEETQPPEPSINNFMEESGDGKISFLQLQVSPDLGIAVGSSPQNLEQETADAIANASEVELLANTEVDGSGHTDIPSHNILEQIPILSDAQVSLLTNTSELNADENINDISGHLISTLDTTLITSPGKPQETSIAVGTESSPENLNTNHVELYFGKDLEQCAALVDVCDGVDHNVENRAECEENIAEACTAPPEEIALPSGVTFDDSDNDSIFNDHSCMTPLEHWVLPPGKKYRRSLSIIRNLNDHPSTYARRGRHYEKSVEEVVRLQGNNVEAWTPVQSLRQRLSVRRSSWMRQITPPPVRRSTFMWSPPIPNRGTLFESPLPRKSIYSTPMQHNLVKRMSTRVSPMLGPCRSVRSPHKQDCSPASPVQYTIEDLILTICKQSEPCNFSDILSEESYAGGCKLGEGVFGEVFSITHDGQNTVLKIIPIEGQQLVNGEKQKTYQEVLSELVIAKVLDELRYEGSDEANQTSGFAQLIATSLVQGSYPKTLLRFWEEFDLTKGSDNENPKLFGDEQLFILMEQGNGGKDLESYSFTSAKQSLSVLKQVAFSLAVAEISLEFEHRDLHWGNILVSKTSEKQIFYTLNGTRYSVASNGVKSTIIDYTLSRIKYINQVPIYNDIGKDPEMFIATGDYQFDIYRFMKKDVEDDWSRFAPKTNARWLHYLLDKMVKKVKYQRKTAKVHKDSFKALVEIGTWMEDCGSALSIALRLAESKH